MRRAFVSHSTADDGHVAEIESFLRAAGFDEVFNDVSAIQPDERFWPAIEKGIASCESIIVVITAASSSSEWVKREVEFARSLTKKIIPLWIEDCPLPPTFTDRDVIDFRPRTQAGRRFDISRIVKYAPAELIGREDETKLLNDARQKVIRLEKGRSHVLTFVALGGEGKTSLVAKWAAELAYQDWPGCEAAFAWSFYSQGTREQIAASSDLFLKEALTFFGNEADKQFAASPAGAYEKGQRLARIVGQRRSLLILDGLEPLQYAPTSPTPGQLKDQGIAALLKGLATASHGLCVVTTRYSLPDLRAFWQTTAPELKLLRLSGAAGVHLLQSFGVKGSLLRNIPFDDGREQVNEFEKLVEDVKGHALTLNLLGTYLRDAHGGDIRKRDLVKLEEADAEEQGGHAFRVMEAYEREFEREGDKGQRALAVLRLLGLFDRPLTADCLGALLQAPAIPGLTEPLVELTETQRNLAFKRLENARLLTVNRDAAGVLATLDAHPLLREYFARQLRDHYLGAWREAHRRLYAHLRRSSANRPDTLEDLQPLFQAVFHGCAAGEFDTTWSDYFNRIQRRNDYYATNQLGAFGADIGALVCFFERPWTSVVAELSDDLAVFVLRQTAFSLRALTRLSEAVQAVHIAMERSRAVTDWLQATMAASTLSDLQLLLGNINEAIHVGAQATEYANSQAEEDRRVVSRVFQANALHQAGRRAEALLLFQSAEEIQSIRRPSAPLLQSTIGFFYCELLIADVERRAWKCTLNFPPVSGEAELIGIADQCHAVSNRATQTLESARIRGHGRSLGDVAMSRLSIARCSLFRAVVQRRTPTSDSVLHIDVCPLVEEAMTGLRQSEQRNTLPAGLLTRAWLRFLIDARTGPESAQADLDEAWEIAERGPMKLLLADIHLHRARLFGASDPGVPYPWGKHPDGTRRGPQDDLAAARKLIETCGYWRRQEELEDAERASKSW